MTGNEITKRTISTVLRGLRSLHPYDDNELTTAIAWIEGNQLEKIENITKQSVIQTLKHLIDVHPFAEEELSAAIKYIDETVPEEK